MNPWQGLSSLLEKWRAEASVLSERYAQPSLAQLATIHADELEAVMTQAGEQLVSLRDAAKISGYSDDHIGRLVRNGTIRNLGRPNAPRVLVSELPRKAERLRDASDDCTSSRKRIVLASQTA